MHLLKKINSSYYQKLLACAILLSFFLIHASLLSQIDISNYPFINVNQNKLYFSKDSSDFLDFYKKIDKLKKNKKEQVTIIHYGGSHIQAGQWSEQLINGFQKLGNFSGGGSFIFPYKLAKTNGPSFYKSFSNGQWTRCRCSLGKEICNELGMAGISVTTNDSSTNFGVKLNKNEHLNSFNSIKIYHNFNASFEIHVGEQTQLQHTRKDYKNKGYTLFTFESPIDSIQFLLTRKDTITKGFTLYGFSLENSDPGFYYASLGVNGASSNSFLRCSLFIDQLKTLSPDLVILSLGVNDTQGKDFTKKDYIAHYDSLIVNIKKAAPNCAILFTTTSDNYINKKTSNKRSIAAEEAIFDLMEKHHAAVWDLFAVMGGYKSMYKWYKAKLAARDKVHFNMKGYTIVGQMMFDAINKSYQYNSKLK